MARAFPDGTEDDEVGALALGQLRGLDRMDRAANEPAAEKRPCIGRGDVALGEIDSRGARRQRGGLDAVRATLRAGAGDPSGTEVEPSADVRSLQAYLRADREPAIELQVAFGMQLACGDARYVAAAWASFRLIGWSTEQPSSSSGHASLAASRSSTPVIRAPASLTARTGPVPG